MPGEKKMRTCHYCGLTKCKCTYRASRKGKHSQVMWNTSRQSTVGDMRESFRKYFLQPDETPAVWSISYTIIDPNYKDKAKATRTS